MPSLFGDVPEDARADLARGAVGDREHAHPSTLDEPEAATEEQVVTESAQRPSEFCRTLGTMIGLQHEEIDETLLLLSEARERAERAARAIAAAGGQAHVVEALERVDRELLAMHRRLMDEAIFHVPSAEQQLALGTA